MKVIFIDSPTGAPFNLAYNIDDVATVPKETGAALIEAGIAVDYKDAKSQLEGDKEPGAAAGAKKSAKKQAAPASEKATDKAPAKAETATKK